MASKIFQSFGIFSWFFCLIFNAGCMYGYKLIIAWLWQLFHEFDHQNQIEDRNYGILGFSLFLYLATAQGIVCLYILVGTCLYWFEDEESRLVIAIQVMVVTIFAIICAVATAILSVGGIPVLVSSAMFLARLAKWLPQFSASGESSNEAFCIACIVILAVVLACPVIALLSLVLLGFVVCIAMCLGFERISEKVKQMLGWMLETVIKGLRLWKRLQKKYRNAETETEIYGEIPARP